MTAGYHDLVARAKREIREIGPADLADRPVVVVDIREPIEVASGTLPGAIPVPRGVLTGAIDRLVPDRSTPIVLVCSVGNRSALAAKELQDMGYRDVASLAGGIARWRAEGRGAVAGGGNEAIRYARHLALPGIGAKGQERLRSARVVVVGAGGLGSPVVMYLAAAGIGVLKIVDDDIVEMSNLQRQVAHDTDRVGLGKAASAATTIQRLNPDVVVEPMDARLSAANALEALGGYDVIVDATDAFPTRYLINDTALHLGVPVVHASVYRWEGQVTVFAPYLGPCYRCLFPSPPAPDLALDCSVTGVLGAQVGVIGSLQAVEVVKLITGAGEPLIGRLLLHDALTQEAATLRVARDPACPSCGDPGRLPRLVDYDAACRPG